MPPMQKWSGEFSSQHGHKREVGHVNWLCSFLIEGSQESQLDQLLGPQ